MWIPGVLTAWANGRATSPISVFRSLYADCNEYRDTQVREKTKSDMGSAASAASRRPRAGPSTTPGVEVHEGDGRAPQVVRDVVGRRYRDVRAGTFHPLTPEATLTYAGKVALGDPGVAE